MIKEIAEIICLLHLGHREEAETLLNDLKTRSIFLDDEIQRDVLIFAEQVDFQYDYDPWHKVTPEVHKAADNLIYSLGFYSPKYHL